MTAPVPGPDLVALQAELARLTTVVGELQQIVNDRGGPSVRGDEQGGHELVYRSTEQFVVDFLLPHYRRPFRTGGMSRFNWCQWWWKHEEAYLRLRALWHLWEQERLKQTGMITWTEKADYQMDRLCSDDGPFRDCGLGDDADSDVGGVAASHVEHDVAPVVLAPRGHWLAFEGFPGVADLTEPDDLRMGADQFLLLDDDWH
jgi:hypothetical protein